MKLFVLLLALALGVWLWSRRGQRKAPPPAARPKDAAPADMVECAVCGLHLPRTEALPGPQGLYCSTQHRQQARG